MSLTVSRGLTDAGRWTAVATAITEFLEQLDDSTLEDAARLSPPPMGAINATKRFFNHVLEGIKADQMAARGRQSSIRRLTSPAMAGMSNLYIAMNVMRSSSRGIASSEPDLDQVRRTVTQYRRTLSQLTDPRKARAADRRSRESLKNFLLELQRQGQIERDAAFAAQEHPRVYR